MAVELAKQGTEWSLSLSGVVGIADAVTLHGYAREVLAGTNRGVIVLLGELKGIDTSITQILLVLKRDLTRDGRACTLQGPHASVVDRWRIAGFDEHLDCRPGA
jgi:anti-anti-sigma regulatory factor